MSLPALAFKEGDRLTDTASAGLSLNPKKLTIVDFFASGACHAVMNCQK